MAAPHPAAGAGADAQAAGTENPAEWARVTARGGAAQTAPMANGWFPQWLAIDGTAAGGRQAGRVRTGGGHRARRRRRMASKDHMTYWGAGAPLMLSCYSAACRPLRRETPWPLEDAPDRSLLRPPSARAGPRPDGVEGSGAAAAPGEAGGRGLGGGSRGAASRAASPSPRRPPHRCL